MPRAVQPPCSSHQTPIRPLGGPSRVFEWTGSEGRGFWLRSKVLHPQQVYPQNRCILKEGQLEVRAQMYKRGLDQR